VYITAKNTYTDGELSCERLKLVDQEGALFLMSTSRVMVIEIVQQINVSVEVVEKTAA